MYFYQMHKIVKVKEKNCHPTFLINHNMLSHRTFQHRNALIHSIFTMCCNLRNVTRLNNRQGDIEFYRLALNTIYSINQIVCIQCLHMGLSFESKIVQYPMFNRLLNKQFLYIVQFLQNGNVGHSTVLRQEAMLCDHYGEQLYAT